MLSRRPISQRRRQAGLSIIELMVGVTIGLLIVAAASLLVSAQLLENRKLMVETQMQQDLRAAADIVTRDLRRAGAWGAASYASVWASDGPNDSCNRFGKLSQATPQDVTYRYFRGSGQDGPLGFRLLNGVVQYSLQKAAGAASGGTTCAPVYTAVNWQDLTDKNIQTITDFSITPSLGPAVQLPCPKLCSNNTKDCWPTVQVRQLTVSITGQSTTDSKVKRTLTSTVRLRNDWVQINNALASPTQSCPA
jgi:type IV pilus assembly protein PilW